MLGRLVFTLFFLLEVVVGLALAAGAGYCIYEKATPLGYAVAVLAALFLAVGVIGLAARSKLPAYLWVLIALAHAAVTGALLVGFIAYFERLISESKANDGSGTGGRYLNDAYEGMRKHRTYIIAGLAANLALELLAIVWTVMTIKRNQAKKRAAAAARGDTNVVVVQPGSGAGAGAGDAVTVV